MHHRYHLSPLLLTLAACASAPEASPTTHTTPRVQAAPTGLEGCATGERTHAGVRLDCGDFEIVAGASWEGGEEVLGGIDATLRETHAARYRSATSSLTAGRSAHATLDYTLRVGDAEVTGRYVHVREEMGSRLLQCTALPTGIERCDAALEEIILGGIPAHLKAPRRGSALLPSMLGRPVFVTPGCTYEAPGRVRCAQAVLTWREVPGGRDVEEVFVRAWRDQLAANLGAVRSRERTCRHRGAQMPCTELRAGEARVWVARVERGSRVALVSCGYKGKRLPALCRQIFSSK